MKMILFHMCMYTYDYMTTYIVQNILVGSVTYLMNEHHANYSAILIYDQCWIAFCCVILVEFCCVNFIQ